MSDNPFQPLPGADAPADAGEPSIPASQIAAQAAAEAVRGPQAVDPPLQSNESQTIQFDTPQQTEQVYEQAEEQVQSVQPVVDQTPHVFASEAYAQLQQLGIDLPVAPQDVSPEFAPAYEKMARSILDNQHSTHEKMVRAENDLARVKDFAQRLGTPEGRERMLLSMALTNPEDFSKSMQTIERMQGDSEYAETVRLKLESMARMEAAQRMEYAQASAQAQTKGRQVEGRTVRLAEAMGINSELAKSQVAARILQNEAMTGVRDITLDEVDMVVRDLANQTGAQPAVRSPQVAQSQQAAPTQQPLADVGQTPTGTDQQMANRVAPTGPAQTPNSDAMDALRSAVKVASKNATNRGLRG